MDRTLSMVIVSFVLGALVSITIQACGGDENKFEQDCGSGNSTSSANCECSWESQNMAYYEICDELWYIYCEKEVRMERLRHNRGYSDKKIEQMLKNQLSDEEFESKCDFQLYNSEDVAHTYLQIERKMRTYYESM